MNAAASHSIRTLTRRYWDCVGERYLELFRDELRLKPFDCELISHFAETVGQGGRVLDAGCGPCTHVSDLLRAAGLKTVGVDLSVKCLRLARAQRADAPLAAMDLRELAFTDECFDGVVAYYANHWTPMAEQPAIFTGLRRVLKPGGILLVAVKEGDQEGYVPDPLGGDVEPYFTLFAEEELTAILRRSGFQILERHVRDPYPEEIANRRILMLACRA